MCSQLPPRVSGFVCPSVGGESAAPPQPTGAYSCTRCARVVHALPVMPPPLPMPRTSGQDLKLLRAVVPEVGCTTSSYFDTWEPAVQEHCASSHCTRERVLLADGRTRTPLADPHVHAQQAEGDPPYSQQQFNRRIPNSAVYEHNLCRRTEGDAGAESTPRNEGVLCVVDTAGNVCTERRKGRQGKGGERRKHADILATI